MTPKERAAMQQALEALEVSTDWDVGAKGKQLQSMKAITALREALAEHKPHKECECSDCLNYFTDKAHEEALAEQAKQEPVAWRNYNSAVNNRLKNTAPQPAQQEPVTISCECGDIYERDSFGGRFIKLHGICPNCDAVPQAEQAPVGEVDCIYDDKAFAIHITGDVVEGQKLYTAPVRTKDLTDDEIQEVMMSVSPTGMNYFIRIARAVIAADREKNNANNNS